MRPWRYSWPGAVLAQHQPAAGLTQTLSGESSTSSDGLWKISRSRSVAGSSSKTWPRDGPPLVEMK